MAVEIAEASEAVFRFDGSRCIFARRCAMGAPVAFKAKVEVPWIDVEALMWIALACPSGVITVECRDGGKQEVAPAASIVTMRENGPPAFHADLEIAGLGRMLRTMLCRYSQPRGRLLCDGSHKAAGVEAS